MGSYTLFSSEDQKAVFKNKPFGVFSKELEHTGKFSVMIRKESIGITNVMKTLQDTSDISWEEFHALGPQERLEFVNNETNYPILFQQLTNYIMDKVKPFKKQEDYIRIWGNSIICDTIVNSILQSSDQFDSVFDMADQAIQVVMNQEVAPSASDFTKRFKQLETNPTLKIYKEVPYFASFNYRTPSFKSVFLGGLAGTGRSMIMTYVAMYAYKNNWILITTPNIMKWTQDRNVKPKKLFNGLFVIEEHVL